MQSKIGTKPSRNLIEAIRVFARTTSRILWRIEFHNTENIPSVDADGFIIAANHQTYMDPVWISIPVRHDIRYLAWDRVFQWPVIGSAISRLGAMPVKLGRGGTLSSLRMSLKILKNGSAMMIFPEGEREYADGELLPFRTGAVHLAEKTGVEILPVTITGAHRVWPQEFRWPRFRKVEIYYHRPMKFLKTKNGKVPDQSLEEKTELLRKIIQGPMKTHD